MNTRCGPFQTVDTAALQKHSISVNVDNMFDKTDGCGGLFEVLEIVPCTVTPLVQYLLGPTSHIFSLQNVVESKRKSYDFFNDSTSDSMTSFDHCSKKCGNFPEGEGVFSHC